MTGESQLDFETKYLQVTGRLKPPTEIEIDAALRYLNNNVLIRQGITHITVKYALADMCREMRYALTKRTTN